MFTKALFLAAFGLAVTDQSPVEQFELRQALFQAAEAADHGQVVELARRLSARQPGDAEVWYLLGRSAFVRGEHELAVDATRRALELGYRYEPWLALRIARSKAALGRNEQALEWLQRALALGLEDRHSIADHAEFEALRNDPDFRSLAGLGSVQDRTAGLSADIDFLVEEARRLHPGYQRVGEAFEAEAAELKSRVGQLDDSEFLFGLMGLVRELDDGHSYVAGPGDDSPLEVTASALPVLFYLFEEGLYVVDGTGPGEKLIGREVALIGRRTPAELLEYSRELHGADNPMTMRWLGVHFYLPRTGFLLSAGAIDDPQAVSLQLTTAAGDPDTVILAAGDYRFPRKLRAPKVDGVEAPRYLQRVDTPYWFEALDESTLYFQFNQVRNGPEASLEQFAGRLGAALQAPPVRTLIVDLRHNNGGNNGLLRPLLRQLVAFDVRENTRIFAITGRNTFSAAQNFVNRLDRLTDAVFAGEPSASSPNFIGEETEVVLPFSRVRASISSRYWQDSDPGDKRAWIAPQLPVPPRASDYFAGRDAVLSAILEVATE